MSTQPTVILPVRDLHNAVKNIMHFAPKALPNNATHLPLDGAHIAVRRGTVVMEATDTAKMIQVNIGTDRDVTVNGQELDKVEEQSFGILGAEDLKELELWLRDTAKSKDEPYPAAQLTFDNETVTVTDASKDQSVTYQISTDQRYPNIDKLMSVFDYDKAPAGVINVYDPMHFQILTKVSDARTTRRHQSLSLSFDARRKAVCVHWISHGDVWAQGLMMPLIEPGVNNGVDLTNPVQF